MHVWILEITLGDDETPWERHRFLAEGFDDALGKAGEFLREARKVDKSMRITSLAEADFEISEIPKEELEVK